MCVCVCVFHGSYNWNGKLNVLVKTGMCLLSFVLISHSILSIIIFVHHFIPFVYIVAYVRTFILVISIFEPTLEYDTFPS